MCQDSSAYYQGDLKHMCSLYEKRFDKKWNFLLIELPTCKPADVNNKREIGSEMSSCGLPDLRIGLLMLSSKTIS